MAGRSRSRALVPELSISAITDRQYHLAFKMMSALASERQICLATGLGAAQLREITVRGIPSRNLPALGPLMLEQLAEIRNRAREAAAAVGVEAVKAIEQQTKVAQVAQGLLLALLAEMSLEFRAAKQGGTSPLDAVPKRDAIELIKALKPMADYAWVGNMYRTVFDGRSHEDPVSRLPRGEAGQYAEHLTPALFAQLAAPAEGAADDLSALLPDIDSWSEADLMEYALSGRMPDDDLDPERELPPVPDDDAEGTAPSGSGGEAPTPD